MTSEHETDSQEPETVMLGAFLAEHEKGPGFPAVEALRYTRYYGNGGGIYRHSSREEVAAAIAERGSLSYGDAETVTGSVRFADGEAPIDGKPWRGADFLALPHTSGSDYGDGGATVALANVRALKGELDSMAENAGIRSRDLYCEATGGHGTFALWVRTDAMLERDSCERLLELAKGLQNYPVLDDDSLSEVEAERESESWENGSRDDFAKALASRIADLCGFDKQDIEIDNPQNDKGDALRVLWHATDPGGLIAQEDPGAFFDVEECAKRVTLEKMLALGVRIVPDWRYIALDIVSRDPEIVSQARDTMATCLRLEGAAKAIASMLADFAGPGASGFIGCDASQFDRLRPEHIRSGPLPVFGPVSADEWSNGAKHAREGSITLKRWSARAKDYRETTVRLDCAAGGYDSDTVRDFLKEA